MHAGQHHLLESGVRRGLDATQHLGDGTTAPAAARAGNDAVAAAIVTAGLHGERVHGAARRRRLDRRAAGAVAGLVSQRIDQRLDVGDERLLAVVRHHCPDTGERGQLVGRASRVAPGDDDPGLRIATGDPSNRLPGRPVGRRRDGARVDDDEIGLLRRGRAASAGAQIAVDACRIGLIDAAPEREDREFHHESSRAAAWSTLAAREAL